MPTVPQQYGYPNNENTNRHSGAGHCHGNPPTEMALQRQRSTEMPREGGLVFPKNEPPDLLFTIKWSALKS